MDQTQTPRGAIGGAVAALLLAATAAASARELDNFDINRDLGKPMGGHATKATDGGYASSSDAIGRATFTWVQRAMPAEAKLGRADPEAAARAHLAWLLGASKHGAPAAQVLSGPQPGGRTWSSSRRNWVAYRSFEKTSRCCSMPS